MKPSRSFASDNNAAVHPEALEAIRRANQGHVVGYGDDPHTESAIEKFREHFGADVAVFFVFNGTRSEAHTSELQSRQYLVCRLLLEKKKYHTENATKHQPHAPCRTYTTRSVTR